MRVYAPAVRRPFAATPAAPVPARAARGPAAAFSAAADAAGAGFDFARTPVSPAAGPIQRVITVAGGTSAGTHATEGGKSTKQLIRDLESDGRASQWKRGWKGWVGGRAGDKTTTHGYSDITALADAVHAQHAKPAASPSARPGFSSTVYTLAKAVHSTVTGQDESGISLADEDLAVPHRVPFADLRHNLDLFTSGQEGATDLTRWTDRLVKGTEARRRETESSTHSALLPRDYGKKVDKQVRDLKRRRDDLIASPGDPSAHAALLSSLNSLHGNVPGLGPHTTVNIPVSDRLHLNLYEHAPPSPGTEAALNLSPHRSRKGVAVTKDGKKVVTPRGDTVPIKKLPKDVQKKLKRQKLSKTTLI